MMEDFMRAFRKTVEAASTDEIIEMFGILVEVKEAEIERLQTVLDGLAEAHEPTVGLLGLANKCQCKWHRKWREHDRSNHPDE